jgi:hypothetical protein
MYFIVLGKRKRGGQKPGLFDGAIWRRKNEYDKTVFVALKTCKVSCFDLKEVKHTVEVSAGSIYEAVAQALRIFRDNEWVEDLGRGQTPIYALTYWARSCILELNRRVFELGGTTRPKRVEPPVRSDQQSLGLLIVQSEKMTRSVTNVQRRFRCLLRRS